MLDNSTEDAKMNLLSLALIIEFDENTNFSS